MDVQTDKAIRMYCLFSKGQHNKIATILGDILPKKKKLCLSKGPIKISKNPTNPIKLKIIIGIL